MGRDAETALRPIGGPSLTTLRTRSSASVTTLLFLLCVFVLPQETIASSRKVLLTIFDFTSFSYRAEVADYGNPMDAQIVYASTLMVPPKNHSLLCEFPHEMLPPQELQDENATDVPTSFTNWEFGVPVALLVSLGGCHPSVKAEVALEIQQKVMADLKYVVFYNNNPNDPDSIVTLSRPTQPINGDGLPNVTDGESEYFYGCEEDETDDDCVDMQELERRMIFVSVSTGTGSAILGRMERLAAATTTRPEIMSPENRQWNFPMVLERVSDDGHGYGSGGNSSNDDGSTGAGQYPESDGDWTNSSFFWFRAVLFTLLIVSPCFRAAYLWHARGGRIHIRRNEEGRIVGLLYVPPMTNWFGHHQGAESSPVYDRLTAEQVMALPEIVYVMPVDDSDGHCDADVDDGNNRITVTKEVTREHGRQDPAETLAAFSGTCTTEGQSMETIESMQELTSLEDIHIRISSGYSESYNVQAFGGTRTRRPESNASEPCPAGGADQIVAVDGAPMDREDESPNLVPEVPTPAVVCSSTGDGTDEEQPVDGVRPSFRPCTTTTCTTCSICIDEFEQGETLRLLPRCGHAFHTGCILPWLTERQGCCPLCKTSVLETAEREGEGQHGGAEVEDDDGNSTEENTDASSS